MAHSIRSRRAARFVVHVFLISLILSCRTDNARPASGGNIVPNGGFDLKEDLEDGTGWRMYWGQEGIGFAKGKASISDGKAIVTITDVPHYSGSFIPKLYINGRKFTQGTRYRVDIRARADSEIGIVVNIGRPLDKDPWYEGFADPHPLRLSRDWQDLSFFFAMSKPDSSDGGINIELGNDKKPAVVEIDSVRITEVPYSSETGPNYVVRGNLMRSRDAFVQRKAGRVAFLGGSVTLFAWREKVMSYLARKFPDTAFDFINAGLGGTPAELGAFRLEEDVFPRGAVDLLFLEFAVNGGSIEAMEGIVRHARALSPDIDIVQMHIAARWFSESLDNGGMPGAVTAHEKVAEYYGNSSLHLYREIYDRMNEGRYTWEQFAPDGVHPTELGSSLYADFIIRFLETMWSREDEIPMPPSMPSPLTPDPWEHGSLISYSKASSIGGFEYVTDWMPASNGNLNRPVSFIASSSPGSTVSFPFRGTRVGLYTVVGPDSGKVEYRIDDSVWVELDTMRDSWYPNPSYRLNGFLLSTSLSDNAHVISFRTVEDVNKVFRLVSLMVG
jgi:hypothetical protein